MHIDGLPQPGNDALLHALFVRPLQPNYRFAHQWSEQDLLMWDNIRTIHKAVADYGPDEHRLVQRCQAMANLVFRPDWARRTAPPRGAPRRRSRL